MKKYIKLTIFLFVILNFTSLSYAHNMGTKLKRGFVNIITAPIEIPKQTSQYWKKGTEKSKHPCIWLFPGFIKGVVNTVGRLGSGLWDVVTFNIEMPAHYEPLMKPDYVLEDWNEPLPDKTTNP